MDNLKLPAYPVEVSWEGNKLQEGHQTGNVLSQLYGFTKLELASLMIAQGLVAKYKLNDPSDQGIIAQLSVELAKAVLEEANK